MLKNEWLAENKIELKLIYEYDFNQSMLISSPKSGHKDIPLSFYRLSYDPTDKTFYIDRKLKEVTFPNRKEIKRFLSTVHTVVNT